MKSIVYVIAIALLFAVGCYETPDFSDVAADAARRQNQFEVAMKALDALDSADSVQATAYLKNEDARVRRAAVFRLSTHATDPESAADAVARVLSSDSDRRVRTAAARALATLDSPAGNNALVNSLCDKDYNVRLYAWKSALRRLGTMVPALADALESQSPSRKMSCPSDGFKDSSHSLYAETRDRIEQTGDLIVPAMVDVIDTLNLKQQATVLSLFGQLGEKSLPALAVIIEKMRSEEPSIRLSAIRALGKVGDRHPDVMPALVAASRSTVAEETEAAKQAISGIQATFAKPVPTKSPASRGAKRRTVPRQPR